MCIYTYICVYFVNNCSGLSDSDKIRTNFLFSYDDVIFVGQLSCKFEPNLFSRYTTFFGSKQNKHNQVVKLVEFVLRFKNCKR